MPILDLPPQLILPDHWQAKRPAIIRPAERDLIEASVIPGIGALAGGGPSLELSLFTTTTGTGGNITVPATVNDGDFGIICGSTDATAYNGGAATGWNQAAGGGGGTGIGGRILYKKLTVADRNVVVAVFGSSGTRVSTMAVYRPTAPIGTVNWIDKGSVWSDTAAAPTVVIDATAETDPVIVTAVSGGNGTISAFATQTPAFQTLLGPVSSRVITGHTLYNSSPLSHTVKPTDPGVINFGVGYFRLRAA